MTQPLVVLLHALGRSSLSLLYPENRLRRAGFRTLNLDYPSRRKEVADLAEGVFELLPTDEKEPIHFLTHSMGGIVLRQLAQAHPELSIGRAVMLGPPNQGSQLATRFSDWTLFRRWLGPAAVELQDTAEAVPRQLGPVGFPVGVIAGSKALDPLAWLLDGPGDGRVSIEETRVEGMQDFLVAPTSHVWMMNRPGVMDQVIHFLRHGSFDPEQSFSPSLPFRSKPW